MCRFVVVVSCLFLCRSLRLDLLTRLHPHLVLACLVTAFVLFAGGGNVHAVFPVGGIGGRCTTPLLLFLGARLPSATALLAGGGNWGYCIPPLLLFPCLLVRLPGTSALLAGGGNWGYRISPLPLVPNARYLGVASLACSHGSLLAGGGMGDCHIFPPPLGPHSSHGATLAHATSLSHDDSRLLPECNLAFSSMHHVTAYHIIPVYLCYLKHI